MDDIVQSLPLCVSLAALGGAFEVAATAVTAVPAVKEREGIQISKWMNTVLVACNVTLQLLGSVMSHLIATWFGPVSLVVPFFFSSCLLCNILVVGILKEPFTKTMRVGTYVIVVSVILLPSVGPTIQDDQTFENIMMNSWPDRWYILVWFFALLIASLCTGMFLAVGNIMTFTNDTTLRFAILLTARASSLCINLTVSRLLVLDPPTKVILIGLIATKIITGGIYTYAIVVQSYAVEQSKFVPINATIIILINSMTGIIIWEDWLTIQSWIGYVCVFALLGLGCDLLLSGTPQLNNENPAFGLAATFRHPSVSTATANQQHNQHNQYASFEMYDDTINDSDDCNTSNDIFEGFEDEVKSTNSRKSRRRSGSSNARHLATINNNKHRKSRRSTMSTREAWQDVVSPVNKTSTLYTSFIHGTPLQPRSNDDNNNPIILLNDNNNNDNNNNNNNGNNNTDPPTSNAASIGNGGGNSTDDDNSTGGYGTMR